VGVVDDIGGGSGCGGGGDGDGEGSFGEGGRCGG